MKSSYIFDYCLAGKQTRISTFVWCCVFTETQDKSRQNPSNGPEEDSHMTHVIAAVVGIRSIAELRKEDLSCMESGV